MRILSTAAVLALVSALLPGTAWSDDLGEVHAETANLIDQLEAAGSQAQQTLEVVRRMQRASEAYAANRGDLAAGIRWARATADGIAEIENYIAGGLPDFVEDMLTGYLSAVPVYVEALTRQVRERIARIDAADRTTTVYFNDDVACENAPFSEGAVRVMRGVAADEWDAQELFKASCGLGFRAALRRKGYL